MATDIVVLTYNQKVEMNGQQGEIFTLQGYAERVGITAEDVAQKLRTWRDRGEDEVGVISRSAILHGDRRMAKRDNEAWAQAVKLVDGQQVQVDGRTYTVHFVRPGVSDFLRFRTVAG